MGRRLLVVDDDASFATFLDDALTDAGHTVESFTNPNHALDAMRAGRARPDVILIDLVMPGLTGRDVLVALRADPNLRDIPVVLISALPVPNLGAALGAVAVLRKPVALDDLRHVIEQL
jgi:two-component system, OmpR family, phosphate regulon response regulator PhoB